MGVRADVRLDDGAMQSVTCTTCRALVEVRKSSWEQTSIQWHTDAVAACLERRASSFGAGPNGGVFAGCSALATSVREAAVRGEIRVQSGDPTPTNREGR